MGGGAQKTHKVGGKSNHALVWCLIFFFLGPGIRGPREGGEGGGPLGLPRKKKEGPVSVSVTSARPAKVTQEKRTTSLIFAVLKGGGVQGKGAIWWWEGEGAGERGI